MFPANNSTYANTNRSEFNGDSSLSNSESQPWTEFDVSIYLILSSEEPADTVQSVYPEPPQLMEEPIEALSDDASSEEKSKRWDIDHWALYMIYSLSKTYGQDKLQISFTHARRSYQRFDKDFAEFLLQEFEPQICNDEKLKKIWVDDLSKRTKSKFNTLKRSFFKSKKQRIPDFPFYIYSESQKIIEQGKSKLSLRLKKIMMAWRDFHIEQQTQIGAQLLKAKDQTGNFTFNPSKYVKKSGNRKNRL